MYAGRLIEGLLIFKPARAVLLGHDPLSKGNAGPVGRINKPAFPFLLEPAQSFSGGHQGILRPLVVYGPGGIILINIDHIDIIIMIEFVLPIKIDIGTRLIRVADRDQNTAVPAEGFFHFIEGVMSYPGEQAPDIGLGLRRGRTTRSPGEMLPGINQSGK